jgi:UDP-N-acetylglucosamine acyltransferase
MLDIHATTIVHPKAQLGANVVIGPYSVIGPDVVIGDDTWIGAHAVIEGRTTLGKANRVFHSAVVGAPPQDLKYRGETTFLRIGDRNTIREFASLHLACIEGEATEIGDGCLIMAYAHVAHNCRIGNGVILANSVNLAGHVEVHDFASVGGLTPVHQFVRIGAYAFVGGGSRVPKDVIPFVKAGGIPIQLAGINTIGLERRGFDPDRRALLQRAYRVLFRSGLNVSQALARLKSEFDPADEDIQTLVRFIERSERGIHT